MAAIAHVRRLCVVRCRLQTGMRGAFGKPQGVCARVAIGQVSNCPKQLSSRFIRSAWLGVFPEHACGVQGFNYQRCTSLHLSTAPPVLCYPLLTFLLRCCCPSVPRRTMPLSPLSPFAAPSSSSLAARRSSTPGSGKHSRWVGKCLSLAVLTG